MPEEDLHEGCIRVIDLRTAAIIDHEMYMSWILAGFTETQAFELLKTWKRAAFEEDKEE